MSKSKETVTYNVTMQDADGNVSIAEGVENDAPLKGDTFEYEHKEVRVGTVIRVERVTTDKDGNVSVEAVTEIGDSHYALEEPEVGDELPEVAELTDTPPDDDNPPDENNTAATVEA